MKKIILSFISIVIYTSITFAQTTEAEVAFRITEQDLIPEGITYSAVTNNFYVSSILKTKIVKIDASTKEVKDFIPSELINRRFVGMMTDDKRGHLWACANLKDATGRYNSVFKFDLKSGKLLKHYTYTSDLKKLFNDLTIDKDGNIYFTDSEHQHIYFIDTKTDEVSIFFESEEIFRPNGISISADFSKLYIASLTKGVRVLDIKSKKLLNDVDEDCVSCGLDGLKLYNKKLYGIQNYFADSKLIKIIRLDLNKAGTKIINTEIIDQKNEHFDIPTTFVIVDDALYCMASSQLDNVDFTKYEIIDKNELKDVLILKYELEK